MSNGLLLLKLQVYMDESIEKTELALDISREILRNSNDPEMEKTKNDLLEINHHLRLILAKLPNPVSRHNEDHCCRQQDVPGLRSSGEETQQNPPKDQENNHP